MSVLGDVLAANRAYADSFGAKGGLALPPARRFAILTCMDARLDPAKYAGLSEGDAHVIRNAGEPGPLPTSWKPSGPSAAVSRLLASRSPITSLVKNSMPQSVWWTTNHSRVPRSL